VDLNLEKCEIIISGEKYTFPTLPKEILAIRDAGGLLEYTKKKLAQR
jgi:hypothetical protein